MDKVLTTALLTIAAIVAAVMVVNAILPALGTGGGSVVSSSTAAADRIKTAIEIIHVAPPSGNEVHFWVKNVGASEIQGIENADVFVEGSDEYRMQFGNAAPPTDCSGSANDNKWFYNYEDANDSWTKSTTVRITVCVSGNAPTAVQFTTANGVTDRALTDG